jgi:hypothetical protein
MGQVVQLSKYRRPPGGCGGRPQAPESAPRYYCRCCDNESFNLLSNGEVRCTCCNRVMRNLAVSADRGLEIPG